MVVEVLAGQRHPAAFVGDDVNDGRLAGRRSVSSRGAKHSSAGAEIARVPGGLG